MPGSQKLTPPSSARELFIEHANKSKARHKAVRRKRRCDRPNKLRLPTAASKRIEQSIGLMSTPRFSPISR